MYCYLCNHWHPREEESNVQRMEYSGEFLDINFDLNLGLFYALAYLAFNLSAGNFSLITRKWAVDGSRLSIDKVIQEVHVKQLMQLVRVTRVNTSQLSCFSTSSNFPFFVFFYHFQGVISGENNDANSAHLVMKIFNLFIWLGQLNSWICHSLSQWVSESGFDFSHFREHCRTVVHNVTDHDYNDYDTDYNDYNYYNDYKD